MGPGNAAVVEQDDVDLFREIDPGSCNAQRKFAYLKGPAYVVSKLDEECKHLEEIKLGRPLGRQHAVITKVV